MKVYTYLDNIKNLVKEKRHGMCNSKQFYPIPLIVRKAQNGMVKTLTAVAVGSLFLVYNKKFLKSVWVFIGNLN
jgi:hypothetical protein